MFHAQPLDLVHGLEVDLDRVAGASDGGREPLDLGEGCLQTVPLRRVLLTAFGDGEGGSVKVASSVQMANFLTEGRPARS